MYVPRTLCLLVHGPYSGVVSSGIRNVIQSGELLTVEKTIPSRVVPLISTVDVIVTDMESSPLDPDTFKQFIREKATTATVFAGNRPEAQNASVGSRYDYACYTDTSLSDLVAKILS